MLGLWICMIILHVRQAFEDTSGSKYARVLNMARLHMQGLRRVPNISHYGSIRFNNAWRCLNMPYYPSICPNMAEYCWMSLNMPENAWLNCSYYVRVLNIPRYSHNNIIIIATNVIILEFLSARFVHTDALLPFYLF